MKKTCTFEQYKSYCQQLEQSLNDNECFTAIYRVSTHPFLKFHDGQFLEITFYKQRLIKINLLYSLPYQIPSFYFMVYDQNSRPFTATEVYEQYINKSQSNTKLDPLNEQNGIYMTQNPITKQYFYSIHHCELAMEINYLVPFYMSLLGLHPVIVISLPK